MIFVLHRARHIEKVLAPELAPVILTCSVGWLILVVPVILFLIILLRALRKFALGRLALVELRLVLRLFLVPKVIVLLLITLPKLIRPTVSRESVLPTCLLIVILMVLLHLWRLLQRERWGVQCGPLRLFWLWLFLLCFLLVLFVLGCLL